MSLEAHGGILYIGQEAKQAQKTISPGVDKKHMS